MAKQSGPLLFEGSLGNLTGYQLNGKYYIKRKTVVSRRKLLTDHRYENTRRHAGYFASAQKIASKVYRECRRRMIRDTGNAMRDTRYAVRDLRSIWYPLRNRAQSLVRQRLNEEKIIEILKKEFLQPLHIHKPIVAAPINQSTDKQFNLGRTINRDLIPKICDELSAYLSLINQLIKPGHASVFGKEKNRLEKKLKVFRR